MRKTLIELPAGFDSESIWTNSVLFAPLFTNNTIMKTDVLIIGGGPGGSAMAMFLLREGIKPVILEQEEFPRFHIGESMTGEAARPCDDLALRRR